MMQRSLEGSLRIALLDRTQHGADFPQATAARLGEASDTRRNWVIRAFMVRNSVGRMLLPLPSRQHVVKNALGNNDLLNVFGFVSGLELVHRPFELLDLLVIGGRRKKLGCQCFQRTAHLVDAGDIALRIIATPSDRGSRW